MYVWNLGKHVALDELSRFEVTAEIQNVGVVRCQISDFAMCDARGRLNTVLKSQGFEFLKFVSLRANVVSSSDATVCRRASILPTRPSHFV